MSAANSLACTEDIVRTCCGGCISGGTLAGVLVGVVIATNIVSISCTWYLMKKRNENTANKDQNVNEVNPDTNGSIPENRVGNRIEMPPPINIISTRQETDSFTSDGDESVNGGYYDTPETDENVTSNQYPRGSKNQGYAEDQEEYIEMVPPNVQRSSFGLEMKDLADARHALRPSRQELTPNTTGSAMINIDETYDYELPEKGSDVTDIPRPPLWDNPPPLQPKPGHMRSTNPNR